MPTKNRKDIYRRRGMITVALGEDKIKLVELAKQRGVSVSNLAATAICQYEDLCVLLEDSQDEVRYLLSWIGDHTYCNVKNALSDLNDMRLQRSKDREEDKRDF